MRGIRADLPAAGLPCTAPEPETASHRKFAEGYVLTRNTITWFYKQYVRSPKEYSDFRFAPLIADDLSNLPTALVLVAGYDPLRDEGVDYARRMIEAGNHVTLVNYEAIRLLPDGRRRGRGEQRLRSRRRLKLSLRSGRTAALAHIHWCHPRKGGDPGRRGAARMPRHFWVPAFARKTT
jgi:hypothetical protein